jgi:hypothetical protein
MRFEGFTLRMWRSAIGQSCASPSANRGGEAPFGIFLCVNLRVAPPARAANSLLLLPLFPPAARCALTCVESIICLPAGRLFPASSQNSGHAVVGRSVMFEPFPRYISSAFDNFGRFRQALYEITSYGICKAR